MKKTVPLCSLWLVNGAHQSRSPNTGGPLPRRLVISIVPRGRGYLFGGAVSGNCRRAGREWRGNVGRYRCADCWILASGNPRVSSLALSPFMWGRKETRGCVGAWYRYAVIVRQGLRGAVLGLPGGLLLPHCAKLRPETCVVTL